MQSYSETGCDAVLGDPMNIVEKWIIYPFMTVKTGLINVADVASLWTGADVVMTKIPREGKSLAVVQWCMNEDGIGGDIV